MHAVLEVSFSCYTLSHTKGKFFSPSSCTHTLAHTLFYLHTQIHTHTHTKYKSVGQKSNKKKSHVLNIKPKLPSLEHDSIQLWSRRVCSSLDSTTTRRNPNPYNLNPEA